MAYTPTNWECGDVVTAEALNKIENGIEEALECCEGNAPLYVTLTDNGGVKTADHTASQVKEAFENGRDVKAVFYYGELTTTVYTLRFIEGDGNGGYLASFSNASSSSVGIQIDSVELDDNATWLSYSKYIPVS